MTDMTSEQIEALCQWIEDGASCGLLGDDASLAATKLQQALTAIRQLQRGWRGIESAPRSGGVLLTWADGSVSFGRYDHERNYKNPRPMFVGHHRGTQWMRDNQPIAWQPMPEPAPLSPAGDV